MKSQAQRPGLGHMTVRAVLLVGAIVAMLLAANSATEIVGPIRFEEIGAKAGVRHLHHTRKFSGKNADVLGMFTSGGSSVAVGDYDNDGFDDLFVTDSDNGQPSKLYHNDGKGGFSDVTDRAVVAGVLAGGVAGDVGSGIGAGLGSGNNPLSIVADALWFDYDNDGWRDLLVARFGTPILYHNERGGKFRDVSKQSGLNKFGNTIAVIAFDYDNDGKLDLLFGNYFQPENLLDLKNPKVLPNDLDNAVNGGGVTLWRGDGRGTFVEVTDKAGLANRKGWTLDVGHGDFNGDGFQDIYVASDYGSDWLYMNNGDGTFRDVTEKAIGIDTKKGMNAEIADYDNDGWLDVYVTNITDEYMKECNMLWHNNGDWVGSDGTFTDLSKETGTCDTLWGWSAKFADFDNDGWLDLFAVNGLRSAGKENYIPALLPMITTPGIDFRDVNNWPAIGNMSWSGFQKKKLFRNLGGAAFKELSAAAGVDNELDGRGLGVFDYDNDGRLDFYQVNADQPALLYHNLTEPVGNWIELRLIGTKSNRDAIGAMVKLSSGGKQMLRQVDGGNGYAGQSTTRLHFGLGAADKPLGNIDSLEIRWPSGLKEKVSVPVKRITAVEEGKGVITK